MSRRLLILLLLSSFIATNAYAIYEFKSKICATGSNCTDEDYNALSTWENVMDDDDGSVDLTGSAFKCGAWDGQSGSNIADHANVTWDGGSSTGQLMHMTNRTGSTDYYLEVLTGTLANDDTVSDGTNTFNINGTPDSCQLTAEVYNDDGIYQNTAGSIAGFTCSATNYVKITAPEGERHNGTDNGGVTFKYYDMGAYGAVLNINSSYCIIEYMIVKISTWNSYTKGITMHGDYISGATIRNNLVTTFSYHTNSSMTAIASDSRFSTTKIYNNIVYNFNRDGGTNKSYTGINAVWSQLVYNNTTFQCDTGMVGGSGSLPVAKNNISYGNYNVDYWSFNPASTNNLSSDATAPAYNTYYRNKTLSFVNTTSGSEDLHLASTDTDAIDMGADLSGTFTDDIDGKTRSGTWDIGADEYFASGFTNLGGIKYLKGLKLTGFKSQ